MAVSFCNTRSQIITYLTGGYMKTFGKIALVAILIVTFAMLFSACSSKSSDSTTSGTSGGTVSAITTSTQGRQAAASSTQSASMSQGSGQTFRNLGNVGLTATGNDVPHFRTSNTFKSKGALAKVEKVSAKFAKSNAAMAAAQSMRKAVNAAKASISSAPSSTSGTINCADGGSVAYTGTIDLTAGTFGLDLTFSSCREDDSQTGGLYKLSATETSTSLTMNITLGTTATPFTILDYSAGYSALIANTAMSAFSLTETLTVSATSISLDMKADGTMSYHDYFTGEDYSLQFTNNYDQLVSIATAGSATNPSSVTLAFTTNGDFKEVWSAPTSTTSAAAARAVASGPSVTHSVSASFTALKLDLTIGGLTSTVTSTVPYEEVTLNGQFSITFSPETCMSGSFKFVTNTPIRAGLATGNTYQGKITINDATVITYNADGTVTVTTAAVDTKFNSKAEMVPDECEIAEMGGDTAPSSTAVSSNGTYTATGNVTITLTWNKVNDMDLHLAHWVTKPTSNASLPSISSSGVTTNSDWHLYFGTGPGGACSNSNYIGTSTSMIAELDIDKCSSVGYGPEHITMTTMQTGYYIVFVDAYTASEATVNDLSIQVGDKVFTYPAHTFQSDLDANWIAAAFSVSASGVVTLETPMTNSINYTGAMRAPKF